MKEMKIVEMKGGELCVGEARKRVSRSKTLLPGVCRGAERSSAHARRAFLIRFVESYCFNLFILVLLIHFTLLMLISINL